LGCKNNPNSRSEGRAKSKISIKCKETVVAILHEMNKSRGVSICMA